MEKRNKVLIVLMIILSIIILALGGFIFYHKVLNTNNNIDNNNNNETKPNITVLKDEYLWKMKVSNKDGAVVYDYPQGETLTTLNYNTEIYATGDLYHSDKVCSTNDEDSCDYKTVYYITVAYFNDTDSTTDYGYIKYDNLTLIDNSVYLGTEYETKQYYYVDGNNTYLYDGPGMLFENHNHKIPANTILEGKYYNSFSNHNAKWIYVTYENNSGWIVECSDHSVDNPYDANVEDGNTNYNNCLRKSIKTNKTITTGSKSINLYSEDNKIIGKIPANTKLTYDWTRFPDLGIETLHVTYKNQSGWITIVDGDNCKNYTGEDIWQYYDEKTDTNKFC